MGGPFFTPNGITTHTNAPKYVKKAILNWSFGGIDI
jgi:hypothetical protein